MNLDDLKVVWDTQNDEPMYVLDQAALHASVRESTGSVQRMTDVFDYVHIGVLLFIAFVPALKRLVTSHHLDWLDWITIVGMPLVGIIAALALVRVRVQRRRQESTFPQNIAGDLAKSIFQVDYKCVRFKRFPVWFALPVAFILILNLAKTEFRVTDLGGKAVAVTFLAFALAMTVCYVSMWWEKRAVIDSLKASLVSIRDKLVDERP